MASITAGRRPPVVPSPTSLREDLGTVAVATLLILGVFSDGWAHQQFGGDLESFLTPWHGVIGVGIAACAGWVALLAHRRRQPGIPLQFTLPAGYAAAGVGAIAFAVGFAADGLWHTVFGIEVDIDALLSPSHLLMFVAAMLVLTAPIRAAWQRADDGRANWREHGAVVASLTLATLLLAFFTMYLWPFSGFTFTAGYARFTAQSGDYQPLLDELGQVVGLAGIFLTTIVLLGPIAIVSRRWRLPAGACTTVLVTTGLLMGAIDEFESGRLLPALLVAGAVADVLVRRWQPGPQRPTVVRRFLAVVAAVLWAGYFVAAWAWYGIGWVIELPVGAVVFAGLLGYGLGLVAAPPALPAMSTDGPGQPEQAAAQVGSP